MEREEKMLPLEIRAPCMILLFGCFLIVFFHLLRKKLGSFLALFLSAFPTYLAIQPFSGGVLHTDFRDEIIPLFLRKPATSLAALGAALSMLLFARVLSTRVGKQGYRSLNHMLGGMLLVFFITLGKELALLFISAWLTAFLFAESLRGLARRGKRDKLIDFANELLSKAARNPLEEKFFAPSFFTLMASLLVVAFLPLRSSLGALLVLSFADPSAALVGIRYGRHKWSHNPPKSLEGSIAMASVTFFVLLPFASLLPSLLVAISVALFESMPLAMSDNLVIPLLTGMLLSAVKV